MNFKHTIHTDAGYKNGKSSHHYRIRHQGKTIKSQSFTSHASNPLEAEIVSITAALQYAVEKELKGTVIKTDSKSVVIMMNNRHLNIEKFIKKFHGKSAHAINIESLIRDINHMRKMKDKIKAQMVHVKREKNHIADRECRKVNIEKKLKAFRGGKFRKYGLAEC